MHLLATFIWWKVCLLCNATECLNEACTSPSIGLSCCVQGYNSYEAYLQYPHEVATLQELDQKISGGATVAVACVEVGRDGCKVWSANVGNTRVVLCESMEKCEQLSVDHDATNEEELERLAKLGLDKAKIRADGRLGGYENFRCLGDYALKGGYRDVDDIRWVIAVTVDYRMLHLIQYL